MWLNLINMIENERSQTPNHASYIIPFISSIKPSKTGEWWGFGTSCSSTEPREERARARDTNEKEKRRQPDFAAP